jgi:hypothetical protein
MKQKIQKIIENSARKSRKQKKEFLLFGRVMVYIQDPLVSDAVNFEDIIIQLEEFVPPHLFDGIDLIYVGHFQDLFDRELEATYENAAILITNTLANNIDYIENIVHETGHALESNNALQIYGDKKVEKEFLGKRKRLFHRIRSEGHGAEHIDEMEPEYQEEMDKFLYQELGYESLNYLINGLFLNPYAVTSLREYFASGIEKYLLSADDRKYLKILSPKLIEKIEELINGY